MDTPKQTVIKVMGLGGGGSNAVNRMIELGLEGVDFICANTDGQALAQSLAPTRLRLGPNLTRGLGAGGTPETGRQAAEESRADIKHALSGADMVFLTAGMGGGTGTGAISVAAEVARSLGALTIGIVTTPFTFEGSRRWRNAEEGLALLRPHTDTLVTVSNDRLLTLLKKETRFELALRVADEVLRQGVQGIAELISRPGLINIDFAHVRALMELAGSALMAIGVGRGEGKACLATRQALHMPLLDVRSLEAARGVLVHFTGGDDLSLVEISQAAREIQKAAPGAELVLGATIDPLMTGRAQVILVVTGVTAPPLHQALTGSDLVIQRPSLRKVAHHPAPPHVAEPAAPVAAPSPLADHLFQRALTPDPLERPWVVSESGGPDLNNPDMPAFLRRGRTLRDFERSK